MGNISPQEAVRQLNEVIDARGKGVSAALEAIPPLPKFDFGEGSQTRAAVASGPAKPSSRER